MENDAEFVAINVIVCCYTGIDDKINGNDRTGHKPPNSPPSNEAPPTTTTATPTSSTKDSEEGRSSTTQQLAESTDSKPSSNPNLGTGSSDHTDGETLPTKESSTKASIEVGDVDKSVLNQGKGHDGNSGVTDCGKHGCDGSGVIAIAVVASICFIIIVLVVAVLLKKVITDNRRRRFKNVDYLINGMYT